MSGPWNVSKVFKLSSVSGLRAWTDYLPVETVSPGRGFSFDDGGASGLEILDDVTGLRAWVDYVPVYEVAGGKHHHFDDNGVMPIFNAPSGGGGGGGSSDTFFITPDNAVWDEVFTRQSGDPTRIIDVIDDPINPGRDVWDLNMNSRVDSWTFDEAGTSDTWDIKALVYQSVTTGGMVGGPISNINLLPPGPLNGNGETYIVGYGAVTSNYSPYIDAVRIASPATELGDNAPFTIEDSFNFNDDVWTWIHLRTEPTGVGDEIRIRVRTWEPDTESEPADGVWDIDVNYTWSSLYNISDLPSLSGMAGFLLDFHTATHPYYIRAIGFGKDGAIAPTS